MKTPRLSKTNVAPIVILGLVLILAIIGLATYYRSSHGTPVLATVPSSDVTVILSPHYDDAVLSLGGFLAEKPHQAVVATFFTGAPETATTTHWDAISGFDSSTAAAPARVKENQDALGKGVLIKDYGYPDFQYGRTQSDSDMEAEIAQDIQALIASYGSTTINVFGPAYFTPDITHPDHALLHKAFTDVARSYPKTNVRFFTYEDYPYVEAYNQTSVISLEKNLENESGLLYDEMSIPLSSEDVAAKINNLKKYSSQVEAFSSLKEDILSGAEHYTSTRCGTDPAFACEAVYEVLRY